MSAVNAGAAQNSQSSEDPLDPERQCREAMSRWNLQPGDAIDFFNKDNAKRGTARPGDQETTLTSNIFGLRTVRKDVYKYHVEFKKVLIRGRRGGTSFPLVDPLRNEPDFTTYQNRQMHRKLLKAFIVKYPNVFGNDPENFCYDFATTLYSLIDLVSFENPMVLEEEETIEAVDRSYIVNLALKKPENNVFNIWDLMKRSTNDLFEERNEIIRFLELATSRYAAEHPEDHVMYESKNTYFMNGQNSGFPNLDLNNGKYLLSGASKTIACIEGPKNIGAAAVIIDSKKTPFIHSMNLLQLIALGLKVDRNVIFNPEQLEIAERYLKRLQVFPIYGKRQRFPLTLSCFVRNNAYEAIINQKGNNISIAEYFKQKYNVILQYPQWPLAKGQKKINGHYPLFALEMLHVADYQRVGNGNVTSKDTKAIVKACAVNPARKAEEIKKCYESFCFDIDQFMKNAKMSVFDKPMEVKARILKTPRIQYADNNSLNPEQNGKWRLPQQAKYVRCSNVRTWRAFFLPVHPHERMTLIDFRAFVERYQDEGRHHGLVISEPIEICETEFDRSSIEKAFKTSSEDGCQFVLIGHSDHDSSMHSFIKGLERQYSLISQCVTTKTIANVLNRSPLSLENIIAKTNVKLGGLNYNVVLKDFPIDSDILFIGLGMNHPAGGIVGAAGLPANAYQDGNVGADGSPFPSNVSVLGFAANDGVSPNEFIGNFFFSPMYRDEKVSVIDKLLEEIFERFRANRNCAPSRVIFYRNGCDEGNYRSVLRYETPIIIAVAKKYAPDAPITVIIPSKTHQVRFFLKNINPTGRSDEQNIRPGTVVDTAATSNNVCEFYLNSHLAIQGTAKTPKYSIIYHSEKTVELDMFERWTNALCYNFQIVTSPTSLPAPLYVAQRYAERGRQIYNTFSTIEANLGDGNGKDGGNMDAADATVSNGNGLNGNVPAVQHVPQNQFYLKSLDYNFTQRENLRNKRINA